MSQDKGLEFSAVFMTGVEEGLLPMKRKGSPDPTAQFEAVEEERRLAYVGMTRARKFLLISWRMWGSTRYGPKKNLPSRFFSNFLREPVGIPYLPLSRVVVRKNRPRWRTGSQI